MGRDYSVMSYFTPEGVDAGAPRPFNQRTGDKHEDEWHIGVQISDTARKTLGSGQEEGCLKCAIDVWHVHSLLQTTD